MEKKGAAATKRARKAENVECDFIAPGTKKAAIASIADKATPGGDSSEHQIDKVLFEPFDYISQIPGKDIRGKLISCFSKWLPVPEDKLIIIKDIVSSLHNASLLIDDIEDNSKLRRGVPVAHTIYGVASTINCANYVYFHAMEKCHKLNNPGCTVVFIQELLNLHRGQGHDIYWRDQCKCPTEEEYKQMVLDKTGGLFRLAVSLMQCFAVDTGASARASAASQTDSSASASDSSASRSIHADYTPLLNLLGYYFQVRDDYLNVSSDAYMQTKSFCEDLTEGKFSFPIIHAIRSFPSDTRLLNILKQKTENYELKKYAVSYMFMCGSMAYTRAKLRELHAELIAEIRSLGGHKELEELMFYLDRELDREDSGGSSSAAASSSSSSASGSAAALPKTSAKASVEDAKAIAPAPQSSHSTAPNPTMATIAASLHPSQSANDADGSFRSGKGFKGSGNSSAVASGSDLSSPGASHGTSSPVAGSSAGVGGARGGGGLRRNNSSAKVSTL